MILLAFLIACSSVVLPVHTASSQDRQKWAAVEAQGEFIIGDAARGTKCSPATNTFQMRADGSWLPSSKFDLTGNFEDGCGISVTLSIPDEHAALDEMIDEVIDEKELENDIEILKENQAKLNASEKEVEAREKELEKEKKLHKDKMEKVKELLAEVKKMEELEEKKKLLKEKENEILERRKALKSKEDSFGEREKKYTTKLDEYNMKDKVEDKFEDIENEKNRLKSLYENCNPLSPVMALLVNGNNTLCS